MHIVDMGERVCRKNHVDVAEACFRLRRDTLGKVVVYDIESFALQRLDDIRRRIYADGLKSGRTQRFQKYAVIATELEDARSGYVRKNRYELLGVLPEMIGQRFN